MMMTTTTTQAGNDVGKKNSRNSIYIKSQIRYDALVSKRMKYCVHSANVFAENINVMQHKYEIHPRTDT